MNDVTVDELTVYLSHSLKHSSLPPVLVEDLLATHDKDLPAPCRVPSLWHLCAKFFFDNPKLISDASVRKRVNVLRKQLHWSSQIQQNNNNNNNDDKEDEKDLFVLRGSPCRPYVSHLALSLALWMRRSGDAPVCLGSFAPALQERSDGGLAQHSVLVSQMGAQWKGWTAEERQKAIGEWVEKVRWRTLRRLLGLRETEGSLGEERVPPSREVLRASFRELHTANVSSKKVVVATLHVGGRALSKHCGRCSKGWWGDAEGPSEAVNAKAEAILEKLLQDAVWCNMHWLPHDVAVYEVRVKEGYGARWSADGKEFRGFLEPPSLDGHEHGWKH